MANIQKYGEWDAGTAEKEREESAAAGKGSFAQIKVGRNTYRVLPPRFGKRSPFRVVYKHFIDIPGLKTIFTCPRMEAKKHCPACAKVDQLRATGNEKDYELAGEILPQRNIYCNVLDRAAPEKGVQILRIGKGVHEFLLGLRTDEVGGGDYTHPVDGFDIVITRSGTTKNDTKYVPTAARQNSPLSDDPVIMEELLESMHDLDALARLPSEEELAKVGSQRAEVDASGGGGRQPPPRGRGGASPGTRARAARSASDDAVDTDDDIPY